MSKQISIGIMPGAYSGQAGKVIAVNSTEDGVEFAAAAGGSPGGSDKQVQYNNASAFGGISNGSAGQVLTSNGAGSAPSFQAAGGGSGPVQTITVTLTAAQLKALHATPIQIVAAPGANKVLLIQSVFLKYTHVTTDYTTPDGSRLQFGPHDQVVNDYSTWESPGSNSTGPAILRGIIDAVDYGVLQLGFGLGGENGGLTPGSYVINQALVVGNPGSEFTDGDGTLFVFVSYVVVTLS